LKQFGIPKEKAEPFGWNNDPKDVLVWHTKTSSSSAKGDNHGYVFEEKKQPPVNATKVT
jgi:hypothetical protein